jgi:hypothetical protein
MKNFFQNLFNGKEPVYIVSGLPRSGTSMMMKMLEAGGIPPLTDNIRTADEDNPKGYYEFERVKKLRDGDTGWLPDAGGKAVKVIGALLVDLPEGYPYKVLFMRRDMDEILASQERMLENRGEASKIDDATMAALFEKHLRQVYEWMENQPDLSYLEVDYNAALKDPQSTAEKVNQFLGRKLDVKAMVDTIDVNLYRQRK